MSHDYAKQKPCGRHTHKRTLRLPSIAKLTFDTKNSETGQRNEEEKLSQYDSKNGGNATIWRQRWRQELLEFDQSTITPIARRLRGTPKNLTRGRGHRKVREKASLSKLLPKNWSELMIFNETEQQRQKVRI